MFVLVAVDDTDVVGQKQRGFDVVAQVGDGALFQQYLSGFAKSFEVGDGVVVGQEMVSCRDVFQCCVAVYFQRGVLVANSGEFVEFGADFYRIWWRVGAGNEVDDVVGVMEDYDGCDAA